MCITAPYFEAEKYITGPKKCITGHRMCITGRKKYLTGRKKYITARKNCITGRKNYITARKTWQIYLTGPLGLYRRTQPPYRAGKNLLNWGSLRIF